MLFLNNADLEPCGSFEVSCDGAAGAWCMPHEEQYKSWRHHSHIPGHVPCVPWREYHDMVPLTRLWLHSFHYVVTFLCLATIKDGA